MEKDLNLLDQVREATNCGITKCYHALIVRGNNVELAIEYIERSPLAAVMSDRERYPKWWALNHPDGDMNAQERVDKIDAAIKLLREVEFSYPVGHETRRMMYAVMVENFSLTKIGALLTNLREKSWKERKQL